MKDNEIHPANRRKTSRKMRTGLYEVIIVTNVATIIVIINHDIITDKMTRMNSIVCVLAPSNPVRGGL